MEDETKEALEKRLETAASAYTGIAVSRGQNSVDVKTNNTDAYAIAAVVRAALDLQRDANIPELTIGNDGYDRLVFEVSKDWE